VTETKLTTQTDNLTRRVWQHSLLLAKALSCVYIENNL